jgi:hypothetical protein
MLTSVLVEGCLSELFGDDGDAACEVCFSFCGEAEYGS